MGLIRWLADQIQSTTGEKERRERTARMHDLADEFKEKVSAAVEKLNTAISEFNNWIRKLNAVRVEKIKDNIVSLNHALGKYGNCKPIEAYVDESEKLQCEFPEEDYETLQDYLKEIDWTDDEVFWNTFFRTPIGMRVKTRNQNIQLAQNANSLQLMIEETVKELSLKKFTTDLETEICKIYIENVTFISETIRNVIVPEFRVVDAFFQAESIKDRVLVDHAEGDGNVEYPIATLLETKYEKHYQFVKNAFAFYVIACKIYDTPVLTKLLNHCVTETDQEKIQRENNILKIQAECVRNEAVLNG